MASVYVLVYGSARPPPEELASGCVETAETGSGCWHSLDWRSARSQPRPSQNALGALADGNVSGPGLAVGFVSVSVAQLAVLGGWWWATARGRLMG